MRSASVILLTFSITACSLIEIQGASDPLPERDLNARMLTRDYALYFGTTVAMQANEIINGSERLEDRVDAFRWKISAASEVVIAATQISPMLALADTWTLTAQMDAYLRSAAQADRFGAYRAGALDTSAELLRGIRDVARRVTTPAEFSRLSDIVDAHVAAHPMANLALTRVSLAASPAIDTESELLRLQTVGTAAEAMSDVADRMRLYTLLMRYSTRWQIEMLALESGIGEGEIADTLNRLDAHLAALASFANDSPDHLAVLTADVDRTLRGTSRDFEKSALAIIAALREEREALGGEFDDRWVDIYAAIDTQRSATATDIERISHSLVEEFWANLRAAMQHFMVLAILFVVLLLMLPFVAGYLVGRSRTGVVG